MNVDFSEDEAEILKNVLNRFIIETRSEIRHTDTGTFRDRLKDEEELAKRLLEKISP